MVVALATMIMSAIGLRWRMSGDYVRDLQERVALLEKEETIWKKDRAQWERDRQLWSDEKAELQQQIWRLWQRIDELGRKTP